MIPGEIRLSVHRHVKLFKNGRNQAVRIPREFELPGEDAIMHRDGDRLIIEPAAPRSLLAVLAQLSPLDESFPEIDDPRAGPIRHGIAVTLCESGGLPSRWRAS